jgi:hypothetical protein
VDYGVTMNDIRFDAETHTYWLGKQRVPSVTEIMRAVFGRPEGPPDVIEAARQRGVAVHRLCELYDLGELDMASVDPRLEGYLASWIAFVKQTGFIPLRTEYRVHHRAQGYAGTLDSYGTMETSLGMVSCLLDRKCTYDSMPQTGIQTAGYTQALTAQHSHLRVTQRMEVRLTPEGRPRVTTFEDSDDFNGWHGCLNIWRWKETRGLNKL